MKLRLPNKLQAALIAAITAVGFTLSQVQAATVTMETITFNPTGTGVGAWGGTSASDYNLGVDSDSWSLTKVKDGAGVGTKSANGQLRPNTNVETESGWILSFTITNTGDTAQTISAITLNSFLFSGTNGYQNNNTARKFNTTLSFGGVDYSKTDYVITSNGGANPPSGVLSYTLDAPVTIAAGGTQTFSFTMDKGSTETNGCFAGLTSIVMSYVPAIISSTWQGTEGANNWTEDAGAWTPAWAAGNDAVFGATEHTTVAVTTAVTAGAVSVSDQNYTFNLSGGSLTADSLTVGSGLEISGSGNVSAGAVTIDAGASLSAKSAGTFTFTSLTGAGAFTIGNGSSTTLNAGGGFTGDLRVEGANTVVKLAGNLGWGASNTAQGSTRKVTAADGGTLDVNGKGDPIQAYKISLEDGGILANTGGNISNGSAQLANLEVVGEHATAYVKATNLFGLLGSGYAETHLSLNGNTLVKQGSNAFMLVRTTVTNGNGQVGTIRVDEGNLDIGSANQNGAYPVSAATTVFQLNGGHLNITKNNANLTARGISTGTNGGGSKIQGNSGSTIILSPGSGEAYTFAGSVAITPNITKNGEGIQKFTGDLHAMNGGAVSVTEGTLSLVNSHGTAGTLGSVSVSGGSLELGGMTVSGATNVSGGSLSITSAATFNGNFTMAANTTVTNTGTVNFGGVTIKLAQGGFVNNAAADAITFNAGTVFDLSLLTEGENHTYTLFSGTGAAVDLSTYNYTVANITGFEGADQYGWSFNSTGTITYSDTFVYDWAGTENPWSDGGAGWTRNGVDAPYLSSSDSDAVFGASEAPGFNKEVAVSSAVEAHNVKVQDAYTFNLSESGSIAAAALVLEGDNIHLDINGTGAQSVHAISLHGAGEVDVNTGATLQADSITAEEGKSLTIGGTGTLTIAAVNGAGITTVNTATVTGDAVAINGGGTVTFASGETISFAGLNVSGNGTDVTFNSLVTVTGDTRTSIGYEEPATEGATTTFNAGYAYTGGNAYALVVGNGDTVKLGGTTNLAQKTVGLNASGKLVVLGGADATVGRLFNSDTAASNGTVEVQESASLTVAGNGGNSTITNLSNAGTVTLNGTTTVVSAFTNTGTVSVAGSGASSLSTLNVNNGDQTVDMGNISLTNAELHIGSGAESRVRNISTLTVDGTARLTQNSWNNFMHIVALNDGTGSAARTFTWYMGTTHYTNSILYLDGAGTFSGTLVAQRANNASSNGAYQGHLQINDQQALQNAVLQVTGANESNYMSVALNADEVEIRGLEGNASSLIYAGTASTAQNGGKTRPTSTGTATLAMNVADEASHTYAGAVLGGITLKKSGTGTQLFSGDMTAFNGGLNVQGGKLGITAALTSATTVNIAENATLELGSNLSISGSMTGAGNLTYTGSAAATLNFSDKDISGWTGSFANTSSAAVTLNITKANERVNAAIGGAGSTGAINLSLANDIYFDNAVYANDVLNNANHTFYLETNTTTGLSGVMTATGRVTTGRLVVGATDASAATVFTLDGVNAYITKNAQTHTYGEPLQGYGTFKLVNGATQTLTGNMKDSGSNKGFYGTFWADGEGSVLTINTANIYGEQVTFKATNGGKVVLTSAVKVKETEVAGGTFDLNAAVETLAVSGENNTLNIGTGSVDNINLGGNLTANGDMTIFSGTTGTTVTADAGKTLAVNGTAHVDGRVEFLSSETQDVQIAATRVGEKEQYALGSGNFDVTADTVEKVATSDVTIANKVSAREVKNSGAGKLSLTTGVDMAALKKVFATSGDIEFLNVDSQTKATLDTLNIAGGKTVSFSTDSNIGDVATEATVTVTGTLTAGANATLNANLEMGGTENAPAVLDVSAMEGRGGLNMGSSVTLNSGNVALSDGDMELITGLDFKDKYDLFNGVEDFYVGGQHYGDTDVWVNAKDVFTNLATAEKDYYLFYSGAGAAGGQGGNVGTIYIMQIPEPTTGTLSLLALAALVARRRRK